MFFIAALGFFLHAMQPVRQACTLEATPKPMGGSAIGRLLGAESPGASLALLPRGFKPSPAPVLHERTQFHMKEILDSMSE